MAVDAHWPEPGVLLMKIIDSMLVTHAADAPPPKQRRRVAVER